MNRIPATRALDTVRAAWFLVGIQWLYRVRGQRAAAKATNRAMRVSPSLQADVDVRGVDAWQTARAVWRAKRWLPLRSTCLQTALATQKLFESKGLHATVRIGVINVEDDAHAWAEIGTFILDDQGIASRFSAFELEPETRS